MPRFDNNKPSVFFLLDDPSISGFSGSPVFELPTQLVVGTTQTFVNAYRLMGLVHGSIGDKTGGGFAAIVPSKYIVETIKMALQKHKNININHLIYNGEDYANKNNPKFCRRVEIYIKEE